MCWMLLLCSRLCYMSIPEFYHPGSSGDQKGSSAVQYYHSQPNRVAKVADSDVIVVVVGTPRDRTTSTTRGALGQAQSPDAVA